ncbi:MAG: D-cysteine desulfhydrase family protein [Pseudomonadales bacterium]
MAFIDWLHAQPRAPLGHLPTPIEMLPRLSDELGGPRIWVKRDDCTGLAMGGNKTRKLEYLLGRALEEGYRRILTFGAVQSNHARQTAAACARLGLECHLLLSRRVPWSHPGYEKGANVLLDRLCGAQVTIVDLDDVESAFKRLRDHLGGPDKVYIVPAGGSNALGALGYVQCAEEVATQSEALDVHFAHMYHASASAGTQAGLIAGFATLNQATEVIGVNVFHPQAQTLQDRVASLLAGIQEQFNPGSSRGTVTIEHGYLGEGYGLPNAAQLEAMALTARLEGLIFDPVYSGKALHALVDQIGLGRLAGHQDVLLLHSGGTSAWGVYENALDLLQ